jgi:hypothetical protein
MEAQPASETSLLIYRMDVKTKIRFERYETSFGKPERQTHRWGDIIKMISRMDVSVPEGTVQGKEFK